jgi:hypothetical protein
MIEWIKKLLYSKKVDELKKENLELKKKILEKQEQINKTNAYWKKRFYSKNI